jgi:hypothetical protein
MRRKVALVRTDISEERIAFIIRLKRNSKLGTTLAVTNYRSTLRKNVILTRVTRRNIPEDGILHSHCRENLKSYIALTG